MTEKDCYIWLNSINGIGYKTIHKLIKYFGSALSVWESSDKEIYEVPNIRKNMAKRIIESKNIKYIEKYRNKIKTLNVTCLTKNDKMYPDNLINIHDPPYLLYLRGNILKEDNNSIAIVGSRKATAYGKNISYKFAKELVKYGITIVSGMAYGIDSAAHNGALDGGGRTIAVLGCGIDLCYPKSNYNLMKRIINNGVVLSEYPLGTQPLPGNFPQRNRIISGISKSVLVIEAGIKSGSLITADYALEQGKDVFAVPGNINSSASQGTNRLIKEGAKPVTSIEDILEEFNIQKQNFDNNINTELDHFEKAVLKVITEKQPIHIDLVSAILGLNSQKINSIITFLEIKGIIEQLPGKIIIIK